MTCLAIMPDDAPAPRPDLEILHRIPLSGVDTGIVTADGRYLVEHEDDVPWEQVSYRMPRLAEWEKMRFHVYEFEMGLRGVVTDGKGRRTLVNSVRWIS